MKTVTIFMNAAMDKQALQKISCLVFFILPAIL